MGINGQPLGEIEDPCACMVLNQQIKNGQGQVVFTITGSIFQCASCCPCFDMHFDILRNGETVGAVDKVFNGCEELFTQANRFRILFPADATNEEKAILTGAVMLLDFVYFEVEKNNNNNHN